jgi:hypothetical protein
MKFAISAAALILVLGTGSSAYARQDKGQDDHSQAGHQEAKPAEAQAKPEHQDAKPAQTQEHAQQQAKPAEQQHAQAKPEQQQHAQKQVKPTEQQHAQQAKPEQQQHAQQHAVSQQSHASNQNHANYAHGRISDAHYASNFGDGHRFHVSEGDYRNRRFAYGGYSFGFVDPWPIGWGYSDDVYVVYVDDGYYMYDPIHPGVRISLSIF